MINDQQGMTFGVLRVFNREVILNFQITNYFFNGWPQRGHTTHFPVESSLLIIDHLRSAE